MQTAKNNYFLKLCKFWFGGKVYKQVLDVINHSSGTLEQRQQKALSFVKFYFRQGCDPVEEMTKLYAEFGSK
jgi:hypothetical protein